MTIAKKLPAKASSTRKSRAGRASAAESGAAAAGVVMPTIAAADLERLGVSWTTLGQWLSSGVLLLTDEPGVYGQTLETGPLVREHMEARRRVVAS